MSFSDLGLSKNLCSSLQKIGFETPTPIQILAIPSVIHNSDIMASAQTGTGKTAAFLLPAIDFLMHTRRRAKLPQVLILEPTRELALQVFEQFKKFNQSLKAVVLVGGESNILQERALAKGADVLIATPGRLLDLQERQKIIFHGFQMLVIDEADRMLDMGFIPDIDRLVKIIPFHKQTLLFSATFTKEIEKLGEKYLINPKRISAEIVNQAASTIKQFLYMVDVKEKKEALKEILLKNKEKRGVVFCNRKADIDDVVRFVNRLKIKAVPLHGDLSQLQRNTTLDEFKLDEAQMLIASDVAARGIDIADLGLVVNFDVPINVDSYIHRIGRTGRAGNTGLAYSLVTKADLKKLKAIELLMNQSIERIEYKAKKSETPQLKHERAKQNLPKQDIARKKHYEPEEPFFGFGDKIPAFMQRGF